MNIKQAIKSRIPSKSLANFYWRREMLMTKLARMGYRIVDSQIRWFPGGIDQLQCLEFERMPYTPELALRGYELGIFVMPDEKSGYMRWYSPETRGIIPIHDFNIPVNMRRAIRKSTFEIRVDTAFEKVVQACASRQSTWICHDILDTAMELHHMGHAHSVEVWQGTDLVGGSYGIAVGGMYSQESQFHTVTNAGQIAFAYLLHLLRENGFMLHDVQWSSSYLERYGCIEVSREDYKKQLAKALLTHPTFKPLDKFDVSASADANHSSNSEPDKADTQTV